MSDKSFQASRWPLLTTKSTTKARAITEAKTTTCCLLPLILIAGLLLLPYLSLSLWRTWHRFEGSLDNNDNGRAGGVGWLAPSGQPAGLSGSPAETDSKLPQVASLKLLMSKSFNGSSRDQELPFRLDSETARKSHRGSHATSAAATNANPNSIALNRASRSTRTRRVSLTERRPILNEFSFPANLVQGMRFVLVCQVLDGDGPVQIKWLKDNQELSKLELEQATELLGQDELGSSLLFRRVQPQHSGNYTCIATNHFGSSSYSSIMSVKVPPRWKVEPQDQESIMGEQITIDCQAFGNPNPFIRWKFALAGQSANSLEAANNPLPVGNSQLLMGQQQSSVGFPAQQQQQRTGGFGETVELAGSGRAQPAAGQQLATNFKLINSNHHVQSLENGSLSIRQVNKDQEGYYMCEADNGIEPSLIKVIKLIVHLQAQFADEIQAFGFAQGELSSSPNGSLQQLSGKLALSGQPGSALAAGPSAGQLIKTVRLAQNASQLRLSCQPFGDQPLAFDWLKDGHPIYTHSSQTNLEQQAVSAGQSLQVAANGSFSNRYHVSTRRSHQRPGIGLESELLIVNLRRLDAGLYSCLARNSFGSSERKLRLIVQEPPEPPEVVDVAHIGSRSISLRWLSPNYDGNSPISKYIVEYWRHSSSSSAHSPEVDATLPSDASQGVVQSEKIMPLKTSSPEAAAGQQQQQAQQQQQLVLVGQQQQQIQHTLHELEPLTRYSVRVVAVNSIGRSKASVALSLRTEEEVPSVVPSPVEVLVLSSKSIKLHWTITYSPEHEIIDGFFIGYRSFDGPPGLPKQLAGEPAGSDKAQAGPSGAQPTFTYKTIRLTGSFGSGLARQQSPEADSSFLSPVSSATKSLPGSQSQLLAQASYAPAIQPLVVSDFEYTIGGLERNTEYSLLIQCFNKKGAGPTSDSVAFKTFANDPPEKLLLNAEEVSESSLRVAWRFAGGHQPPEEPVDGFVLSFARLLGSQLKFKQANESGPSQQPSGRSQPAAHISSAPIQPQPADQWQAIQLPALQRSHQLKNLDCGSAYAMKIWAFNKVGKGEPSELLTVSTRGKAPVAPDKRSFVSVNSTQVRLHLSAWYNGGCEIDKFVVQYRVRGQPEWILVSNNIFKEQMSVLIRDLAPGTAYELLVSAQNQVGPTEAKYRFSTLGADGKPVAHGRQRSFLNPFGVYAPEQPAAEEQDEEDYYLDGEGLSVRRSGQPWSESLRPLVLVRHLLSGSPSSLLLLASLSLLCLLLLLLYRRVQAAAGSADSLGPSPSNKFRSSSSGGCSLAGHAGGPALLFGHPAEDARQRRLSLEANGSSLPDNCEPPGPPMSLANDSFTDSPRLVGHQQLYQAAADCANYKSYCPPPAAPNQELDYGRADCSLNYCNAGAQNNFSLMAANQQHSPTSYASLQRSATLDGGGVLNGLAGSDQRCLMQMLLLSQQQPQPANQSYVSALTTLSRGKNGVELKANGCLAAGNPPSAFQANNSAATLGRQHLSTFQGASFPRQPQELGNISEQSKRSAGTSGRARETDESRILITVSDDGSDGYQMSILNPQMTPLQAPSSPSCSSGNLTTTTSCSEPKEKKDNQEDYEKLLQPAASLGRREDR